MTFREREYERYASIKNKLFSPEACVDGEYKGRPRPFCLSEEHSTENLFEGIRYEALEYFSNRKIPWHGGLEKIKPKDIPSNHLCCSQSFCVNSLFYFNNKADQLAMVLKSLGYPVKEVLPFENDKHPLDKFNQYLAFEWIGTKNYLKETKFGKVASDSERERGSGFTSADFTIRFLRNDDKIQIILGEWKYTEFYNKGSIQISGSGTDRLKGIYEPELRKSDCPIKLPSNIKAEVLFYDPFDQMMRLQLLAKAMEREHEMGADVVTTMHIAPRENKELMNRITSAELACLGDDVHTTWSRLVGDESFKPVYTEEFLPEIIKASLDDSWKNYMKKRYSWQLRKKSAPNQD